MCLLTAYHEFVIVPLYQCVLMLWLGYNTYPMKTMKITHNSNVHCKSLVYQKKKYSHRRNVIFGIWIHIQKGYFALCHLQHGQWTTWFEAAYSRGNTATLGRKYWCQQFSAHLKDQVQSFRTNGHLWKSVTNWLQKWGKSNVISTCCV